MTQNQAISGTYRAEVGIPVEFDTQISVREMSAGDIPALERMYDSYSELGGTFGLPPTDAVPRRYWLEELRRGNNLVAYVDGAPAGHTVLLPTGGAVQMLTFVHQGFRRRGVATALTSAAIEEARLGGFHYIWLLVAKKDLAAQRWLLKQGFRIAWQDEREIQFMRSTMSG